MIEEVVYTSAQQGIDHTQSGYCVVAQTDEASAAVLDRIVMLSSFKAYESDNGLPTNYSHQFFRHDGKRIHVLSRVGYGGKDHTGRDCLFAHHISSTPMTRFAEAGPAWVCATRQLFYKAWTAKPAKLKPRQLPVGEYDIEQCRIWESRVGSDKFARFLAKKVQEKDPRPVYVVFDPALRMLPLLVEAIALVPKAIRWRVTFSTLYTQLVPKFDCLVRCVVKGSSEHKNAEKNLGQIIDLSAK